MVQDENDPQQMVNPVPLRGVMVKCALNFGADSEVPFMCFGRDSREAGPGAPDSPAVPTSSDGFKARGSTNPLNSVVRRLEAQLARHGGLLESGDFVSTNGRGDDRYYHADDFLDNGDEGDMEGDFFEGELDLTAFKLLEILPGDEAEEESDNEMTDDEDTMNDDAGGNWQTLLSRLEQTKQTLVREVVVELETVQSFPGHTRQKKLKSLRELTAKLRRLLPKVNQVQAHWQAAVWEVVTATNSAATMQSFLDLWNDVSVAKQREEIAKERAELVDKLGELPLIAAAWKQGEALTRPKHEAVFTTLAKLWDLWAQDEECLGRPLPACTGSISRVEKRFAAHLVEICSNLVESLEPVIPYLLRVALFGSKGADSSSVVSLPVTIFLYKKNELLKCKLLEIKSLTHQTVQVVDKEWSDSLVQFDSLAEVFESYQQKYVRKQDRVKLATNVDSWKQFAVKTTADLLPSYTYLYDIALASVGSHGFTDKGGHPLFIPSIGAARQTDLEKKKKQTELAEERKRKRDELEKKSQEKNFNKIPFGEFFHTFPEFDKSLWRANIIEAKE